MLRHPRTSLLAARKMTISFFPRRDKEIEANGAILDAAAKRAWRIAQ
jgi:hypothetical protein